MTKSPLSLLGHRLLPQGPLNREPLRIPQSLWHDAQTESLYCTASRIFLALEILYGKKVVEVRPIGINKGNALRTFLAAASPMTLPIYIGDDQTDEEAFQFLDGRGITILVADRPRPTAAHYLLSNPREVLRFLASLRTLRSASL